MEGSADTDAEVLKDKAFESIYTSCDVEKKNSVPVGVLINYVRPYMQDNTSELLDLEAALDPNNSNPCITSEVFYKNISEWTMKLNKDAPCFVNEKSLHETHPSDSFLVNEKEFPFLQSTPQTRLGQQMLQKPEGGINLNLSNVSGYSLTECSVPIMDTGHLEEKIKELEYRLNKSYSENELLKQQLACSEEQNENLQHELSNVKKRYLCAQQVLESLQTNKKEADDLKEELLEAKKHLEHMRNNYSASEKKVQNLTLWIKQLEEEKSNFSKKTEKNVENTQNLKRQMCDLQDELMSKSIEIQNLECQVVALKEQLAEKVEGYEHLTKNNDLLKQENNCLRNNWKKYIATRNDSVCEKVTINMSPTQIEGALLSVSNSNISLNKRDPRPDDDDDSSELSMSYNSPEFRNQIAHPVTPSLDTPLVDKLIKRNSHLSDECSPILHLKDKGDLLKNVLMKHTSTPEARPTEPHMLLDSSLPSNCKKLPVMEFTAERTQMGNVFSESAVPETLSPNSSSESIEHACEGSMNEAGDGKPSIFQSLNASSDDDVFTHLSAASIENCIIPGESLQDEIANATKGIAMNELMEKVQEHEKCVNIIRSYEDEIATLKAKLTDLENNENQVKYLQQINENEKQLNLLQENLTDKDQMILRIQSTIASQEKEIKQLTSEIKNEWEIKNALWENIKELKAESCKKDITVSRCNELEKKLEVHEKNYSILKEKCIKFENANGELHTTNVKLESIHKDQKEQLNKLSQEITIYKNDVKKYKDSENQQAKVIESVNKALMKAQEDNKNLSEKVARLQSEVKHSKEKVIELQHENKSYKTLLQAQETQIVQCKKDLATVESSLNDKHIELARLESDYEALQDTLSTLRISNKEKETDYLSLKHENDVLESRLTMEKENCVLFKNECEELENSIKGVISKNNICCENLDKNVISDEGSSIINIVSQIDQIIKNFINENQEYKKAIARLESETKLMQNAAKTADETWNQKLLQLSSDKCKAENDYKKLSVDYKSLNVKYERKNKKLNVGNNRLRIFKKRSCLLQQKYNKVNDENVVLKEENAILNEKVENLCNSIDELTSKSRAFEDAYNKLLSDFKIVDDQLQKQKNIQLVTEVSLKRQIDDEKAKGTHWRKSLVKADDDNMKLSKQCDHLRKQHELKQKELVTLNSAFMKIRSSLLTSRENLISSTDLVIAKFKHVLYGQQGDMLNTMSDFAETEYNISVGSTQIETLVDEEIDKLNNQIHNTSKLLEYLASMYSKSTQDVEVQTEITENTSSVCMNTQQKPLNKFTLHQAKHVASCPASPDSPSTIGQFNECSNGAQNLVDECQGILLDLESMENSEGEILIESKFQQAFPNQPDTFLESMELHEDSPRKTNSKVEMEEKFTALVLTWTLDRNSVKERYQSQHELYQKYHQQTILHLTQIKDMLMQHECFTASGTLAPVIQQLEFVRDLINKGFTAAEQCGILRYEIRHTKYWNLVVNYVASLKQELDATQMLSLSTTESLPKTFNDNVNDDTPTKTGELRHRKPQCLKQLQVTTNSENFTCFKEDSILPSVFFCNSWKSILFIVMFFSFVVLGFMMYVQWQCSRSAIKKPVCPLDSISKLFIKRVHIGIPPM